MRKSQEKAGKSFELELRWPPGEANNTRKVKSRYPAAESAGEYLDFLEEFPPAPGNPDTVKIFPERFVL